MANTARRLVSEQQAYGYADTRPAIHVIPGRGRDAQRREGISQGTFTFFKLLIVLIAFFSLICGVRVWLTAATVDTLIAQEQVASDIAAARDYGSKLEVQQTVLTDAERIQSRASELGMYAASDASFFDMATALAVSAAAEEVRSPQGLVSARTIASSDDV